MESAKMIAGQFSAGLQGRRQILRFQQDARRQHDVKVLSNFQPNHLDLAAETSDSNAIHDNENDAGAEKQILVGFAPNDPMNPLNWSTSRRAGYTFIIGLTGMLSSGATAFDSGVVPQASREYNASAQVATLATSLYMVTMGFGCMVSGPLSETVGRNRIYIICLTIFALFTIGSAAAPNVQTWLVCRSFMGLFGSPPLVTFGGSMSDMWSPLERTYIFPMLSIPVFLGPFLAPTIAAFIATSPFQGVNWHLVEWITLFIAGSVSLLIFCFVPETYAPQLLHWKAKALREASGNPAYSSPNEGKKGLGNRILVSVSRPIEYLCTEALVASFSAYLVLLYAILFGFLPGFDFIFGRQGDAIYGLDQKSVGLCYLPLDVGFIIGLLPLAWPIWPRYRSKVAYAEKHGTIVAPEERLWYAFFGAFTMPGSLFWLAYMARPGSSIWSPLVAVGMFGFGTMCIFISTYQYLIDCYKQYAASALVGTTITRYIASAVLVHVSVYMYQDLGVFWALILVGSIAWAMSLIPFVFYIFGPWFRKRSKAAS